MRYAEDHPEWINTKREKLIEKLTAEMKAAARQLEFEKAAYLRDEIKKLREG